MDDQQEIESLHGKLKATWAQYKPLWDDIAKVVGISVDPDYMWSDKGNKAKLLDEYVDDPTAALSVNQAGDYLLGILWGTGQEVIDLVPSRYVEEQVDPQLVQPWYDFATKQTLYHMNHPDCGYTTALRPYCYDQFSFGTSGIGLFKNGAFIRGTEENALVARMYGIDNTCIADGKNGAPDIGSTTYHWTLNRILGEFCCENSEIYAPHLARMPKAIRNAYEQKDFMREFDLVFMWMPRKDFDPKLKGMKGARYRGVWFLDQDGDRKIFAEESFSERPINMCRMIKLRGEVYGRSSGTLLLSSIRSNNFMFAITQEVLEKMARPALGTWGNSIFGDSVLDTSADGFTVFNQTQAQGQLPVFPIHDVGDPAPLIQFLMPYINEKISTAFKIDALLDFSSAKEMTATESLQRYTIRGKSLAGMLGMQKNERLVPDVRRAISVLLEVGEFGIDARKDPDTAKRLMALNKDDRIIPEAVTAVMDSGKPWYEIRFNNELEKLVRTENVQALSQILQATTAIVALYPDIIHAIKWYDLLKALNDNLDSNTQIMVTAKDFKATIENAAKERNQMMQMQIAAGAGAANKDMSTANVNNAKARNEIAK